MQCSLFPFPALGASGGPDVVQRVRVLGGDRSAAGAVPVVELLEATVALLRALPLEIATDFCVEDGGDVRVAVVASDLARDMSVGDMVRAGLHLSASVTGSSAPRVEERIFRVACSNGAIVAFESGQSSVLRAADWQPALERVVARSFSRPGFDADAARFRATLRQMLVSPYELLCRLSAARLVTDDEQSAIQREFDAADDATLYGFINAVTRVAGRLRDDDRWKRSIELERLGGEILRGDHGAPTGELVAY